MNLVLENSLLAEAAKEGIQRFAVGAIVVENGKVLLVRRVPHDSFGGLFEIPGGGVDEGETLISAVVRELEEETGLFALKVSRYVSSFDYASSKGIAIRQFNFLIEHKPETVKLNPDEHDKYVWAAEAEMSNYVTSEPMHQSIMDFFTKHK